MRLNFLILNKEKIKFFNYFIFYLCMTKYRTTLGSNFNKLQKFVTYFGKLLEILSSSIKKLNLWPMKF